jgi:nucleoside-diphosphate-sugar epimerase
MERVLVTGATGYTGFRLVASLCARGHYVRALARSPEKAAKLRDLGARVAIGDLADAPSIAGIATNVDVVYLLAGTLTGGSAGMTHEQFDGTRNLLHQCRVATTGRRGMIKAIVVAGNAAAYGDGAGKTLREDSPCRPSSPLARVSLEVEELASRDRLQHGLPITVLRLGAIYGPGRLSSSHLRQGTFRIVGSGRNFASRIHIDDVIALLRAAPDRATMPVYCVADDEASPIVDYYGEVARLIGVEPPGHVAAWAVRAASRARRIGARRDTGTIDSIAALFTCDQRIDGSRIRSDLGIRLAYPSFRQGLPASVAAESMSPTWLSVTGMAG